jgi:hypothetical protein
MLLEKTLMENLDNSELIGTNTCPISVVTSYDNSLDENKIKLTKGRTSSNNLGWIS